MSDKVKAIDIHNLIQQRLGNKSDSGSKIANLLDYLTNMPQTMMSANPRDLSVNTQPSSPTIPNVQGKTQLMETNSIAQKYPGLLAR